VETIIFLMILGAFAVMLRTRRRLYVIGTWAACLVVTMMLFEYHVTSSLNLRF